MKNRKMIVAMWILSLLPAVLIGALWSRLPEQVPVQWGFDGVVRYDGRGTLWYIAGLGPLMAVLLQFLPKIDPRRKNYQSFQRYYDLFCVILQVFLAVLVTLILVETFRPGSVVIYQAVGILLGLLFIPLGNMMGKVKSNFFIGIRTPWALSDPDVWNRTQRMGGFLLFLSGLISILGAFLLPEKLYFLVLMAFLLGGMGLTAVMSYLWYRRKQAQ